MNKSPRLRTFYSDRMSLTFENDNSSRSPEKPKKLLEFLKRHGLFEHLDIVSDFAPFSHEDFYIAHKKDYVDYFFSDELPQSYRRLLGLTWSKAFAETTRYTNASLYNAIAQSIAHPEEVAFSPSGGYHHATPRKGALYCSFSGQVIASAKIYREQGLSGCYIDLDGHHGNSIDNSYGFVPDLEKALPPEIGNINIASTHGVYLAELREKLDLLEKYITDGKVHYIVFCHGADSHEWDDLGRQLSTEEWIECSELVYGFVHRIQVKLRKQIPLTLCLFGGYRKDDYNTVLSLHTADLVKCLNILCGKEIEYEAVVKEKVVVK